MCLVTAVKNYQQVLKNCIVASCAGEAYSTPPDPLTGFKGPTSKVRGEREERRGKLKGKGREGKSFLLLRFYNLTTADTDICTLALYDVPDLVGLGHNMWLYSMSNIAPQMMLGTPVVHIVLFDIFDLLSRYVDWQWKTSVLFVRHTRYACHTKLTVLCCLNITQTTSLLFRI